MSKYKVFVRCFTFNQAKYIGDAIHGFLMQETDFPFVVGIVDDASTDGNQEIIRKYIDNECNRISPDVDTTDAVFSFFQHKTNNNCSVVCIYLKYNHYSIKKSKNPYIKDLRKNSEYEAMCEGDDYWIDPHKLQKQVDFLNNHKDINLCFTDFNFYHQKTNLFEESILKTQPEKFPHKFTIEEWILLKTYIGPMTWVYRCSIIDQIPELCGVDGTYVWAAFFIAKKKIGCILNETTAVYRISDSGVSHPKKINDVRNRSFGMLKLQLTLVDMYVEKGRESLRKTIIEQWINQGNVKLSYICGSDEGKKIIRENFKYLSVKNKIIYMMFKIAPPIMISIVKMRMKRKGYIFFFLAVMALLVEV